MFVEVEGEERYHYKANQTTHLIIQNVSNDRNLHF